MFDYNPPEVKEPVDYTGLKIVGLLAPVFFIFAFLGDADLGLTTCIVLAMIMLAIKIRWRLRKYVWFWLIIVFILALHLPLILWIRWPQGHGPTLLYTMPIGIVDFLVVMGALGLAEKFFVRGEPQ